MGEDNPMVWKTQLHFCGGGGGGGEDEDEEDDDDGRGDDMGNRSAQFGA